jgi:hypothetical protein
MPTGLSPDKAASSMGRRRTRSLFGIEHLCPTQNLVSEVAAQVSGGA